MRTVYSTCHYALPFVGRRSPVEAQVQSRAARKASMSPLRQHLP